MRAARVWTAVVVLVVAFSGLLALVEAGWPPLRAVDRATTEALRDLTVARPAVVPVMQVVTDLGAPRTWWVLLPVAALAFLVRRRPRPAVYIAVAGAGGGLLNRIVKVTVRRERPDLVEPLSYAPGFAYPSGHAMGSAIGVGVLLIVLGPLLRRRWRGLVIVLGAVLVVGVGFSRVVLGVHWVSDVLGAWLLTAAWVLAVTALLPPWRERAGPGRPPEAGRTDP